MPAGCLCNILGLQTKRHLYIFQKGLHMKISGSKRQPTQSASISRHTVPNVDQGSAGGPALPCAPAGSKRRCILGCYAIAPRPYVGWVFQNRACLGAMQGDMLWWIYVGSTVPQNRAQAPKVRFPFGMAFFEVVSWGKHSLT